jgi:hypothetical protein
MNKPLPDAIEARLELALSAITGKQYRRLLQYIFDNPDQYTHVIGRECAVGYPPARLWELNNELLPPFGLFIRCHAPEQWLTNRWGETSHVHQWRLEMLTASQSQRAEVAA